MTLSKEGDRRRSTETTKHTTEEKGKKSTYKNRRQESGMMIRWWCFGVQKKRNLLRQVYRRITCEVNSFCALHGPRSREERDSMGDRQLFVHCALRVRSWGSKENPTTAPTVWIKAETLGASDYSHSQKSRLIFHSIWWQMYRTVYSFVLHLTMLSTAQINSVEVQHGQLAVNYVQESCRSVIWLYSRNLCGGFWGFTKFLRMGSQTSQ